MSKKKELFVPVVATRGVIVFPNQDVMIEVGRKKSINAIEDAMENYDGHAWIVCQNDIMVDDPKEDDLFTFGTLSKIKSIRRKEGFMRVVFTGLERAQLVKLEDSKEQINATIELVSNIKGDDKHELVLIKKVISEFEKMGTINTNFPPEVITQLTKGVSADTLADQFAQYYPFSIDSKQNLLETLDVNERLLLILDELAKERQMSQIEHSINNKVKERIEGGQREYYLREKLRAIKEELGDVSNITDDTSDLRETIENNPYPEHVKLKALEELQRYEMLPQASGEASVVRSYLDWLLKTPWWQETEDNDDLNMAQQILDEDHYGLKKVKERILEFIAVGKLKGSVQGKMLCFVGPPGVGKTSIGRSIARALGREFHRFSVGGMRDVAEIKGHRRTYIGSMPGKLIQIFKLCKSSNPVIMIDEIDKLAKDYSGDPASALLEVLDPEQNNSFLDHYLDVPFDLSKVLFLCTANMTDTIPEPLLDRMEVLNVSGYIATEKLEIAKRHLIPKITNEFGLKPSQFRMKDEIIHKVIYGYCREAGVRNLQKTLEKIARQIALKIALGERSATSNKEVTEKNLIEYLGNPMFTSTRYYERSPVGVCMGLAWTSLGGTSMYIETSIDKGKSEGSLKCTGNMRDVMKESSSIAYTVAKKILADKQPNNDFFEKYPIHMHTPEGATPKDGPSAGCAMVTALLSLAMNKPVKNNLAMTGEITLTGKVLQIGGVREKTIGAKYAGVNEIILPQDNKRDWEELEKEAPEVTKGMTVHFASYYEDIYKVAFEYEEETTTPKKAKRTRK